MAEFADLPARVVLLFFIYACLGWCVEVAFAAITTRQLVNRGFLNGPLCPIYGFGMLALVAAVYLLPGSAPDQPPGWAAVFVVGMIITTAVELAGGWALFKIFHTRWWDYSMYRFNLGGYICPQFSLLWGLGSVVMVKVVHPFLVRLTAPLPLLPLVIADGVLLLIFGVDVGLSVAAAIGLNKYLSEIDELRAKFRTASDRLTEVIGTNAREADTLLDEQKLQLMLAAMESRDNAAELREQLLEHRRRAADLRDKMDEVQKDRWGKRRLLRAFPDMKSREHGETVAALRRRAAQVRARMADAKAALDEARSR